MKSLVLICSLLAATANAQATMYCKTKVEKTPPNLCGSGIIEMTLMPEMFHTRSFFTLRNGDIPCWGTDEYTQGFTKRRENSTDEFDLMTSETVIAMDRPHQIANKEGELKMISDSQVEIQLKTRTYLLNCIELGNFENTVLVNQKRSDNPLCESTCDNDNDCGEGRKCTAKLSWICGLYYSC